MQTFTVVKGWYRAEITLFQYNNTPPGRCHDCNFGEQMLRCCDSSNTVIGICEGGELCDVYFTYCLRPYGSTGSGCSNYTNVTSNVRNNRNSFSFPQQDMNVLGLPNPLLLPGLTNAYTVRYSPWGGLEHLAEMLVKLLSTKSCWEREPFIIS